MNCLLNKIFISFGIKPIYDFYNINVEIVDETGL